MKATQEVRPEDDSPVMDAAQAAIAAKRDGSLAVVAAHAPPESYADVVDQVRPAAPMAIIALSPDILAQAYLGGAVVAYQV